MVQWCNWAMVQRVQWYNYTNGTIMQMIKFSHCGNGENSAMEQIEKLCNFAKGDAHRTLVH
jgi:hypothetical protein